MTRKRVPPVLLRLVRLRRTFSTPPLNKAHRASNLDLP